MFFLHPSILYLTETIAQDTKTHPTIVFLHAALTFSYPDIGQTQLGTLI